MLPRNTDMASGFKADAQGFLIGEVIENGRDLLRAASQSQAVLKDIRYDVKAIARAVGVQVNTSSRSSGSSRPPPAARVPMGAQRTLGGNYIGGPRPVTTAARTVAATSRAMSAHAAVVFAQPRGSNGLVHRWAASRVAAARRSVMPMVTPRRPAARHRHRAVRPVRSAGRRRARCAERCACGRHSMRPRTLRRGAQRTHSRVGWQKRRCSDE